MSQLYDYECRAETTNVRSKSSYVPFFPNTMIFWDVRIPPNFSNILLFQMYMFLEFFWDSGVSPKFAYVLFFPDIMIFRDVQVPPNFLRMSRFSQ